MNTPRLNAHDLRRIAVAADVDPRTVARVVAGEPVQRANRAAVLSALRAEGFAHFIPTTPPPPPPANEDRTAA